MFFTLIDLDRSTTASISTDQISDAQWLT